MLIQKVRMKEGQKMLGVDVQGFSEKQLTYEKRCLHSCIPIILLQWSLQRGTSSSFHQEC